MPTTLELEQTTEQIAQVVRSLKKNADVSDEMVAAYLGLSRTVTQQRMVAESKWWPAELDRLAQFFEVPIDLLFDEPKAAITRAINDYDVMAVGLKRRREFRNITDQRKASSGWKGVDAGQRRCA